MFILIDKPKGMTSHDVVDEIRKITGERKVGHAGTLDPNATGLLIIAIGRGSTKQIGKLVKKTKVYEAEIVLGETRDTDDVEGKVLKKYKITTPPSKKEVQEALKSFLGEKEQTPPFYSAIKIKGNKSYELARKGKQVELKARKIEIFDIELLEYNFPVLNVRTKVSSGTYIRSLARDVGEVLGCGGYLRNLRRTMIGKFDIDDAVGLEGLTSETLHKHSFDKFE
jgi:tRNA pseudouridine55 synthase